MSQTYDIDAKSGCWDWCGMVHNGVPWQPGPGGGTAGRYFWTDRHGHLPKTGGIETQLTGLCGNTACVNPDHRVIRYPEGAAKRRGCIERVKSLVLWLSLRGPDATGLSWVGPAWACPPERVLWACKTSGQLADRLDVLLAYSVLAHKALRETPVEEDLSRSNALKKALVKDIEGGAT